MEPISRRSWPTSLRLQSGDGEHCHWQGNPLRVTARVALALTMVLRELATNAIRDGSLSKATGTVLIVRTIVDVGGTVAVPRLRLNLRQEEGGGPPVTPPSRKGFGSRMIERGLANELGGEVRISFEPEGGVCTLDVPLEIG
jgi:two-component sensor histidine kinase